MKKTRLLTLILASLPLFGMVGCAKKSDTPKKDDETPQVDPAETGIEVTPPTKVEYLVGEDLNLTGAVVKVILSDGNKKDVTSSSTFTGYDKNVPGNQTITVTYKTFTDTFTVNVIESAPSKIYKVTLDNHSLSIMMDHPVTLHATITPTPESAFAKASFKASSSGIVSVNSDGLVSPLALGEVDVTATYQDGSDTCHVTVVPWTEDNITHVASVKINETNVALNGIGDSKTLTATILPADSTNKNLIWSSNNENVVTVEGGVVTAVGSGSATITVKTEDISSKEDTISVVVKNTTEDYGYNNYGHYYGDLTWTDSEDLKTKLHAIIANSANFKSLKYTGNWDSNQNADQDLYDFGMVDVVYSDEDMLKTDTYQSGKGWQREHGFAASLMTGFTTGEAVSVTGRATDFHNLFASNNSGNGSRGNKNLGYANEDDAFYADFGSYEYDYNNFEPSDNDKGKLARAVFYMGVMYNSTESGTASVTLNYNDEDKAQYGANSKTVKIPFNYHAIQIVEDPVQYDKVSYTAYYYQTTDEIKALVQQYGAGESGYAKYSEANCQFAIGNLSSLIEWNSLGVDLLEYQHNESVYSHVCTTGNVAQGNRNPFVDYPQLVDYVYGALKDQPGDLRYLKPSSLSLKTDVDEISHYAITNVDREFAVGDTFDSNSYELVGVKNNLATVVPDPSVDLTTPYEFTEDDVGVKKVTVKTAINSIDVNVKVKEATIDGCDYHFIDDYEAHNENLFTNKTLTANTGQKVSLNGENWTFTCQNTIKVARDKLGLKFGGGAGTAAGQPVEMTVISEKTFEDVLEIYLQLNTAASATYKVDISVGGELIETISFTRGIDGPVIYKSSLSTPKTGIITFRFYEVSAALYLKGIGIN